MDYARHIDHDHDLLWAFMFPNEGATSAALEILVEPTFHHETSLALVGSEIVVRKAAGSARSYVEHLEGDGPALETKRIAIDEGAVASIVELARRATEAPPPKDDGRRGRDGTRISVHAPGQARIVYLTSDHDDANERHRFVAALLTALTKHTGVRF